MIQDLSDRDGAYDGSSPEKYNYILLTGLYDVLYTIMEPKPICWRFGDTNGYMVTYNNAD